MALVPFGHAQLDPTGDVTPAMETAGAVEVAGISRDLGTTLSRRISRFIAAHPRVTCKCPFCAAHPHAVEYLNVVLVSVEMHADFLDHCRLPTAQEFRDFQRDVCPAAADVPHVAKCGGQE